MVRRDYFLEDYLHTSEVSLDAHGQRPAGLNAHHRLRRAVNEMLGLCKGMIADGQLLDSEISFLNDWFLGNQEVLKNFPAREIYTRIKRIYEDGLVTDEEREDLKELLMKVTGEAMPICSGAVTEKMVPIIGNKATMLPFDDPEPKITFVDQSYSFTGKFLSGTRAWCVEQVMNRGATFHERPTTATSVLVIGALGSRDWAHTSFGRKIEAAMKYKPPMKIVSEQHWAKHLSGD